MVFRYCYSQVCHLLRPWLASLLGASTKDKTVIDVRIIVFLQMSIDTPISNSGRFTALGCLLVDHDI